MKIAVISAGSWGTALADVLCHNGHEVTIWTRSSDYAKEMTQTRSNPRYLPNYAMPANLTATADIELAITDSELIIMSTPSQHLRSSLEKIKAINSNPAPIVNVSKGIENGSLLRMSEVVAEVLPGTDYCILTGPSHAEEVVKKFPTAVLAASKQPALAEKVQEAFNNEYFRVYSGLDIVGAEVGGALKNIFAIAAGISDGIGLGDNTKAALITRGIVEMSRLGQKLGGDTPTFSGLSGIGDLIVTCSSQHSRNRRVGQLLGEGKTMDEIYEALNHSVAEGVKTTLSAYQLATKLGVEIPIITQTYKVLYENKSAKAAIHRLMTRDSKSEEL